MNPPASILPLQPPATPLAQSSANIGVPGNIALTNLTSGISAAGAPVAPGNATPNAPAPTPQNSYITPPEGLKGMPINPPPAIAQQGAQDYQQQTQGGQAVSRNAHNVENAGSSPAPAINQTMMLAAARKAAEDRRMAQLASYNARR